MNESVQKWLDELTAAPSTAIQKLVLGYAGVSAWSRSSLRESFVEIFQTHAEALDAAVAAWLQERLMKLPPEKTPTLVWASHLQDLFSGLAGLPLSQVARLLRGRLRDFRSWLRPLRTDESLDPEAAYLAALAWADTNQHLEGMWQGLALRRDCEPAYYTDIGLLGLRKARDERGQLPSKAPFLLLATLIDLADTGLLQKDWLLTTRALLGGYHYSLETWVREFKAVLKVRQDAAHGPEWLRKVLPQLQSPSQQHPPQRNFVDWERLKRERGELAELLKRQDPSEIKPRIERFVAECRSTAFDQIGRTFVSHTLNDFADSAKNRSPDWAIRCAEEAQEWDGADHTNWVVLARCMWSKGLKARRNNHSGEANLSFREALDLLWEARIKFPHHVHCRTELARMLRISGELKVATTVYREAAADFPANEYCRVRLADTLIEGGHTLEARRILEEAKVLFPAGHLWRKSLADLLNLEGSSQEKETVRVLYEEAAQRGNRDAAKILEGSTRSTNTDEILELDLLSAAEMRPAQRLGRALLFQWQAARKQGQKERERLFTQADALLDLPDELTGECRTAFVEARGFLLLARDRATEARAYFEQQLAAFARVPLGLRLGFAEARARLGETLSDTEEAELASFGPEGGILPLVLKVVRLLESTASDDELRDLLLKLYPEVRRLAGMPASELGEEHEPAKSTAPARQLETPDTMMAQLLLATVFRPAAIHTPADLQAADSIPRVRATLKAHRDDIFAVGEKLALAA
jgi:hypothetical protein